jgi:RHS repeat-associated protein
VYVRPRRTRACGRRGGLNQITSVDEGTSVLTPTYDARGNLTSYNGQSFGYDTYNRLVSKSGTGGSMTLAYDPLGRLWQTSGPSGTARFQYDGAAIIAAYNASGVMQHRWVHGPGMDEPLVRYDGSGMTNRTFLHADERGSIITHTDSTGARTQTNTYDAYGNPGASNAGLFQFTGQVWLEDAGVYYYKNRTYHAELGVFMQADPIGHSGGVNLYAYVGGDPVNFTDPWGLWRWDGDDNDEDPPVEDVITVTGVRFCPRGATCLYGDDALAALSDLFGDIANFGEDLPETIGIYADGELEIIVAEQTVLRCTDGRTRLRNEFRADMSGIDALLHTHNQGTDPTPGPEDGRVVARYGIPNVAVSRSRGRTTAWVVDQQNGQFDIRQILGRSSISDRRQAQRTQSALNNPRARGSGSTDDASGVTCTPVD